MFLTEPDVSFIILISQAYYLVITTLHESSWIICLISKFYNWKRKASALMVYCRNLEHKRNATDIKTDEVRCTVIWYFAAILSTWLDITWLSQTLIIFLLQLRVASVIFRKYVIFSSHERCLLFIYRLVVRVLYNINILILYLNKSWSILEILYSCHLFDFRYTHFSNVQLKAMRYLYL